MTKTKKSISFKQKALFIPLMLVAAILCSCTDTLPEKEQESVTEGGGYGQFENSEGGTLTVSARVSNGSPRHAMPSIPELVYAALLYKDDEISANPESKDFVQGTATEDGKLIFSFQRPDDTSGTFTLEICAFVKTEGESEDDTMQFSRETALLSGIKDKCTIKDDKINVDEPIALSVNGSSKLKGTVSLKIKVPEGCSLEIDDARFSVTGTSPDFTVTQAGDGISAGAYLLKFTVKKGEEKEEIVHIFSEYINVFPGMRTDTWSGLEKDGAKEISQNMISSTVYVRGTGGYYETSTYNETAVASDSNSGSFLSPFASIQKAVDKIIAINDGTSEYTIYVDGKFTQSEKAIMATFSALKKELTLTIKALSNEATLDGGARFDENGNVKEGEEGSEKRIISALCGNGFKLTLENLVIMGANASALYGGGIYFNSVGGMLTMKSCAIRGNAVAMGGGVFIANGSFTMEDGAISGNTATRGSGVYISPAGTFEMSGTAKIAEDNDVYFEGNDTTISVASDLTAESPVATITPSAYTAGTQVLSLASGGTMTQDICDQFAVTPQDDGTEWKIAPSGANGVLMPDSALYVSSGGDDTAGDGTKAKPFATLQKAFDTIKDRNDSTASYTIRISGTVVGGCEIRETSAANVLITGTSADTDILDGGGASYVFYIFSPLSIEIENVKITNGSYGISVNSSNAIVTLCSGAEVSATHTSVNAPAGTFILDGGAILDSGNRNGNPVVFYGKKFIMKSGTIIGGGVRPSGGCVWINGGEFIMDGGTISGGTATNYGGGGVFINSGKFTMRGGTISGCQSTTTNTSYGGGGVFVHGSNCYFTMSGGEITGNTATTSGGGVYVENNGTFTMEGGTISGNTATTSGGGVYVDNSDTFTMEGGTISGNSPDDVYP